MQITKTNGGSREDVCSVLDLINMFVQEVVLHMGAFPQQRDIDFSWATVTGKRGRGVGGEVQDSNESKSRPYGTHHIVKVLCRAFSDPGVFFSITFCQQ